MGQDSERSYVAFVGNTRLAAGDLGQVAMAAKSLIEQGGHDMILILDADTSHPVDVDFCGTSAQVRERLHSADGSSSAAADDKASPPARRAPGRPKLGVTAKEVTLFPRHWEWLSRQPGGASATLRRLVEEARRSTVGEVQVREARESCYRFTAALAGDEPGFEEATRALFAGDRERFREETERWPADVRDHARALAERSF